MVDVKRLGADAPSVVFRMYVFNLPPSLDDGVISVEVDVGRREVAEAFVIATMVVALDKGADAGLEVTR